MDLPGYLKYGKFLLICKFRDLAVDCPDIGTCVEDDAGSSALFHSFDELEQIEVFCLCLASRNPTSAATKIQPLRK